TGGGDEALEKEHEESTRLKNISRIVMGRYEIDAWYFSPYPDGYVTDTLYVCEFTLKYMKRRRAYEKHRGGCAVRSPPGEQIYSAPAPPLGRECISAGLRQPQELSVWEVDGSKAK
ncbi:MAG: hypothetical protein SGPRY_011908, partial [Prymnesium sp.]